MPKRKYQFITDEPIATDSSNYFDFYHKTIAPALKAIIENKTSPHTIGLFGAWGSGKSTIIKTLEEDPDLKINLPVFTFDAWKYQEDTLRRTFLIEFEQFLRKPVNNINLPENILEPLYKSKSESRKVADNKEIPVKLPRHKQVLKYIKNNPVQITALVSLVGYIATGVFLKDSRISEFATSLLGSLAGIGGGVWIFKEFLGEAISNIAKSILGSQKAEAKSLEVMTYQERLNSTEQFEEKFNEMLSY
ncbi:hypothetical protein KC960_04800, partial [Candidatus Saccharibacteria bacterium]|nr:hypothetical protein [Candidatus Saccharibacteria bacterium]